MNRNRQHKIISLIIEKWGFLSFEEAAMKMKTEKPLKYTKNFPFTKSEYSQMLRGYRR